MAASRSAAASTVTVTGVSQASGSNSIVSGVTVRSVPVAPASSSVTFSVGKVESATVKVSLPFSGNCRAARESVIAGVSSSVTATGNSAVTDP